MGDSNKPEKAEQSAEERRLARRGARAFNEFARDYVPKILENADRARVSASERRDLREHAVEATEAQMPRASTLAARSPGGMGGGRAVAGLSAAVSQAPRTTAAQVTGRESELEQRRVAGLTQAVAHGRDALLTPGSGGTAQAGQLATQQAIHDENMRAAEHRHRVSTIMGLAGAGMQGYKEGWFDDLGGSKPEHPSGGHAYADKLAQNRGL